MRWIGGEYTRGVPGPTSHSPTTNQRDANSLTWLKKLISASQRLSTPISANQRQRQSKLIKARAYGRELNASFRLEVTQKEVHMVWSGIAVHVGDT